MKTFKLLFIPIFLLLIMLSCEDVLDRAPLDKIKADEVFSSQGLASAYVTDLYARLPSTDFMGQTTGQCDESTRSTGNSNNVTQGTVNKTSEAFGYWDYTLIRDINNFIENIKVSSIDEAGRLQLEGEVRFLRAYVYFEMAKRYGGVPLVDVVIDPFQEIDIKYTQRSTEEAIFNFIDSELTQAANMLKTDPLPRGRVNKWTALALKARSNLWAASIAKYGTLALNGLVGIPVSRANEFYQKASDAADLVIQSNNYSLYNPVPGNKSENYRRIFIDPNHSEIIFERVYDGINRGHGWDCYNGPWPFAARGGVIDPTLDFILGFENIDGSSEQPVFGENVLYNNATDPFINKDPRLFATVFFDGDEWAGDKVRTYEGIDPSNTPTPSSIISNPALDYKGMPTVGLASRMYSFDERSPNSGFCVKKYLDETKIKIAESESDSNWLLFRLAEMYLIKAEAEFELGKLQNAATALNVTRERAGISLVDESSITLEIVRNEIRSELSYEDHRYWDLRRWRIAESVLNHRFQGLKIIYHYESGKYYFLPLDCETFSRTFKPEHYYNPITSARIDNNPDLVENPLY